MEILLPEPQHCVHMCLVFNGQLQSSRKREERRKGGGGRGRGVEEEKEEEGRRMVRRRRMVREEGNLAQIPLSLTCHYLI